MSKLANTLTAVGLLVAAMSGLGSGVVQHALLYLNLVSASSVGLISSSSLGLDLLSADVWLVIGALGLLAMVVGLALKIAEG
jgi:hypothetical protein